MKLDKIKTLFIMLMFVAFISLTNRVYALTIDSDEITNSSYVIGSYVFTRETNEAHNYNGRLSTDLIMLASKSINSGDLNDMIIYYKTASGAWINGLTGNSINPPETFDINYTNLQLEEINSTVSAPKAPIINFNGGGASAMNNDKTMAYTLNIYIDDIADASNKTDGVEVSVFENGVQEGNLNEDILFSETNSYSIATPNSSYPDNDLEIGRSYHLKQVSFSKTPNAYFDVNVRAYALDSNGKKVYSSYATISWNSEKALPEVQVINNYSNPDYISKTGSNYNYQLSIEQPKALAFKKGLYPNDTDFAYMVYETNGNSISPVGEFKLSESFNILVPENTVKTYYAQIGYYDINGNFVHYVREFNQHFTIDTRKLTAPVLNGDQEGVGDLAENGEYLRLNSTFYTNQDHDSLDYQKEGTEIYKVSGFTYNLISSKSDTMHIFPEGGYGHYTARVYATNAAGKKVYSDFSDIVTVVRTPQIEVSEVVDGKVNITLVNKDQYSNPFRYKIYKWDNGEVELGEFNYNDETVSLNVNENMRIYVRAVAPDYETSSPVYSAPSNEVVINK